MLVNEIVKFSTSTCFHFKITPLCMSGYMIKMDYFCKKKFANIYFSYKYGIKSVRTLIVFSKMVKFAYDIKTEYMWK